MKSADEIVAIVDADNDVVGTSTRREMRAKRLPHRSTYILVFNSQGQLYVQKRTLTKDLFPGYYDPAAGGVVLAGESYEESARRELEEEMGIRDVPLNWLFDFSCVSVTFCDGHRLNPLPQTDWSRSLVFLARPIVVLSFFYAVEVRSTPMTMTVAAANRNFAWDSSNRYVPSRTAKITEHCLSATM
jgi:8-oxo-dGTP pyrophosphatase MutT (NUDIX family)